MKILNVKLNEQSKIECEVMSNNGAIVKVKRTPRKHTKEIGEEQKKGIYSFEIQGILYCYKLTIMVIWNSIENQKISEVKQEQQMKSEGKEGKAKQELI